MFDLYASRLVVLETYQIVFVEAALNLHTVPGVYVQNRWSEWMNGNNWHLPQDRMTILSYYITEVDQGRCKVRYYYMRDSRICRR